MVEIRCESISPHIARIKIFREEFLKKSASLEAEARKGNWSARGKARSFKVFRNGQEVAQFSDVKFFLPEWAKKLDCGGSRAGKGRWTSVEHIIGDSKIFGLGEKTRRLEKSRSTWKMWNTDPGGHYKQDEDPLYCSFPFYLAVSNKGCLALHLDHSEKSIFDVKNRSGSDRVAIAVNQAYLYFYLLTGESLKEILKEYPSLIGKPFLPSRWSLGYHQSKHGYPSSKEEALQLAGKFREKKIPCDVLHLDIQHLDKNKVFTWSKKFGDPKELMKELHDLGFKAVAIVDPGIKIEKGYEPYESGKTEDVFLRDSKGKDFVGSLWPGFCHFPDFLRNDAREWWAKQHKKLLDQGVDGIWNDMNEPSIFFGKKEIERIARKTLKNLDDSDELRKNALKMQTIFSRTPPKIFHSDDEGNPIPHEKVHNLYGLKEAKATARAFELFRSGKRPFILTRSGFPGIQRYAAIWTGDNCSSWNHLKLSIPMCLNLGLSGVPFVGVDVGGFGGDCEPELLTRWTQLGAFLPFFRNHSAINTIHQEPWAFGEPYESINCEAIKLRYKLLPYIYFLFFKAYEEGIPPMRPLFMEFPEDEKSYSVEDEFMLGSALLVSPVLRRKERKRIVYLPFKGGKPIKWENWWTGKIWESGYHLIDTKLESIPLFIREDAGLPVIRSIQNTEKFPNTLRLRCNLTSNAEIPIYWDDGESFDFKEGKYFLGKFIVSRKTKKAEISCDVEKDGYKPFWRDVELDLRMKGTNIKKIVKEF